MPFWMREATLQIGSKVYQMDDLYFEFEVPFEDSDTLQSATFKAYNLAESTRKGIKRGSVIILNAGYEGDIGAIFVGKVSACSHKHDKTNWITSITATAAMDEWLSSKVTKTYAKGSTGQEIVSDLLNIFGLEVGEFTLTLVVIIIQLETVRPELLCYGILIYRTKVDGRFVPYGDIFPHNTSTDN